MPESLGIGCRQGMRGKQAATVAKVESPRHDRIVPFHGDASDPPGKRVFTKGKKHRDVGRPSREDRRSSCSLSRPDDGGSRFHAFCDVGGVSADVTQRHRAAAVPNAPQL